MYASPATLRKGLNRSLMASPGLPLAFNLPYSTGTALHGLRGARVSSGHSLARQPGHAAQGPESKSYVSLQHEVQYNVRVVRIVRLHTVHRTPESEQSPTVEAGRTVRGSEAAADADGESMTWLCGGQAMSSNEASKMDKKSAGRTGSAMIMKTDSSGERPFPSRYAVISSTLSRVCHWESQLGKPEGSGVAHPRAAAGLHFAPGGCPSALNFQ
jgi:hypothetical protein